jgi:methyl-accepting chemotaxis protein
MSLKTRIWTLPLIALSILLLGGVVVGFKASSALHGIDAATTQDFPYLDRATRLQSQLETFHTTLGSAIAQSDKDVLKQAEATARDMRATLDEMAADASRSADTRALSNALDAYLAAAMPAARMMIGVDKGDPANLIGPMQETLKKLQDGAEAARVKARAAFDESATAARGGVHNSITALVIAALLVVVALGGGSYFLVTNVWQQIGGEPAYARSVLAALSQGDLAQQIEVDPKAPESVLAAVRDTASGLATLIANVRGGTEHIASASREIATGNQDLSRRTEEQAASLQRTVASMEQMKVTVRQSAENAKQATQLANLAASSADNGGGVVGQVVTTMDEILSSSKKIAEIVNVIDGIAFQTNILALNAAVEAARAGEDGRGFAVVAGEVRNLAQRSAQAAREIKDMIADSVQKVDSGSSLVNAAGSSMTEIVAQVRRVNDLIAEISSAAMEQSAGIEQITEAVSQMDRVTQQNSALVEQSAAAADSMKSESTRLAEAVSVFRIAA